MPKRKLGYAEMKGHEIQEVISQLLGPALAGETVGVAYLSMISYCILLMRPGITGENLQKCVRIVSEDITSFLQELPEEEDEPDDDDEYPFIEEDELQLAFDFDDFDFGYDADGNLDPKKIN